VDIINQNLVAAKELRRLLIIGDTWFSTGSSTLIYFWTTL